MKPIFYAKKCLKGNVRTHLEDCSLVAKDNHGFYLFALFDGLGGQPHGKTAARTARRMLKQEFLKNDFHHWVITDCQIWFHAVLNKISSYLHMYGQVHQAFKNMGTTAVCVLMLKQEFLVANVGDSRFYIAKKNQVPKVKQITVDQNIKNSDWSQINAIKSIHDEPHLFTFWKILTSCLGGGNKKFKIDFFRIKISSGFYLLTTDGLHNYLTSLQIANILNLPKTKVTNKINRLMQKAQEALSDDNMSAILIEVP